MLVHGAGSASDGRRRMPSLRVRLRNMIFFEVRTSAMPIKTTCPNCAAVYNLADTMRGKQVKCKSCQEAFTVAGVRPANGTARARDDDDYPRRRRPGDDYDDALPRRRGQQKNSKTGLI